MSLFLNETELQNFTYCKSPKAQIHWLKAHSIEYFVNALGKILLARSCLDTVREHGWRKKIFLTKTEALQADKIPRRGVGIYFLIAKNKVLYVGKTTNFFVRMAGHDKGDIPFDSVSFISVPASELDIHEIEYISRFQPRYNIAHNKLGAAWRSAKIFDEGLDVENTERVCGTINGVSI